METRTPRLLPYRLYYKWYAVGLGLTWSAVCLTFVWLVWRQGWGASWSNSSEEMSFLTAGVFFLPGLYLWWLHGKLTRQIQVFPDHVRISNASYMWEISFNDIDHISLPWRSHIRLRMKDGHAWWFSAAMERPDYLWEGIAKARPELMGGKEKFEAFRLKLVQYDHHEKRKEWIMQHWFMDVVNWFLLPVAAMVFGYIMQTEDVVVHSKTMYFFRLALYSYLVTIVCSFSWSGILKKFIFDHRVAEQVKDGSKIRDVQHEDIVLQKAKFLQAVSCCLLMMVILKTNLNLYSITKLRENAQYFQMRAGKTVVVDNRYNCIGCAYSIKEGDVVIFGKGHLGQVVALPGDVIAKTTPGEVGRSIASDSVKSIADGEVAIKTGENGAEMALVPIGELVGKLKMQ